MKRLFILSALILAFAVVPIDAARLSRVVTPDQYKLIITPRIDLEYFLGDVVITVQVREPVREITLNAADLQIGRVYIRDAERKQRAQVELDPDSTTLTLRVRKELVPGSAEIRIAYQGKLRDDLRGLYLSKSARDTYIFTQLQPVDARRFYPCFDEPDMKAVFDLTVIVDVENVAISNTKIISSLPGPSRGTRRVRFARTPPMSTYMLALAIGPLDCLSGRRGDIPVRFCAQNGYEWKGRETFEGAMDLLEFYEDWFRLPYPFEKLDIVALPDMAAGGMENPGAVFLREGWALVDENSGAEAKMWSSTLLAHELSHLWVGDLVTMEWWSDVWLNEGLATWLSAKALRTWKPEIGTDEIQTFRRLKAFSEDSLSSRRAVAAPVNDDHALFELFDIVTNEKPAAVMSMVEQISGEEPLRRAIREYLIRYSWGNASTADFVSHIRSEIGDDAADVIHDFVSVPGYPVVAVTSSCEAGGRLTFVDDAGSQPSRHVPVCYRTLSTDSVEECVVVSGSKTVAIGSACDSPILVNPGVPGYYRALYSKSDLGRIVESAAALSVPERLNLLDNEWWLVTEGHHSIGDYLELLENGFINEHDASVVGMIVGRLGMMDRQYVSAEMRHDFTQWMRSFFGSQLRRVGLRPTRGEQLETASLRREIVWAAGALGRDPVVLEMAQKYVREFLSNPDSVDRSVADMMIHLAARSGDDALYNVYLSKVRRARNAQEGYRFLMGLTSFTSPDLVKRTLELTMTDVVKAQDATNVVGRLLSNPESAEVAWPFIRERWPEIEKRLPVTFTSERIIQAVGSFCSAERRAEVASFFTSSAAAPKTLDASLERIDRCIATRSSQIAGLDAWLSERERIASAGAPKP